MNITVTYDWQKPNGYVVSAHGIQQPLYSGLKGRIFTIGIAPRLPTPTEK